jgi:hypothetical protein
MPIEFCPNCRSTQNIRIVVFPQKEVNTKGKKNISSTRCYDCENCNTFVRSEETSRLKASDNKVNTRTM